MCCLSHSTLTTVCRVQEVPVIVFMSFIVLPVQFYSCKIGLGAINHILYCAGHSALVSGISFVWLLLLSKNTYFVDWSSKNIDNYSYSRNVPFVTNLGHCQLLPNG